MDWLLSNYLNSTSTNICQYHDNYSRQNSFRQCYYRHEIILDIAPSLIELRRQSPILFWAIIITSSRYHPQYSSFHQPLYHAYEPLLGSCLVKSVISLSTIHAILILVTWPFPVQAQPQDPTWNFCGLITNAARHLGLHEPGREKEYGFPRATTKEVELRSKTWLLIFHRNITQVSQNHASNSFPDVLQIKLSHGCASNAC